MLEKTVQDILYPCTKDMHSTVHTIDQFVEKADLVKIHTTAKDFTCSQYILTEQSFYYYNHSNEFEWITSDPAICKQLKQAFPQEIASLSTEQLAKITDITRHRRPDKLNFSFREIRNETYNINRFKEIILVSTDYDMPGKNGVEFIKAAVFPGITLEHITIILTGKISEEFKQKLKTLSLPTEYIAKNDPDRFKKFLKNVAEKTSRVFQECSYKALSVLSQDKKEEACFVFDKEFSKIFTFYLQKNNICEIYLFDRQGSYLFLDADANLSWFILRSEKGMQNSLQKAIEHGAPASVIHALESKQFVLSLYEEDDFLKFKGKEIEWNKYLHAASIFESKINSKAFESTLNKGRTDSNLKKFYYAFISDFPESGIDKNKILSYQAFLRGKMS